MINIIIWFATFLCPNPTHTAENHGHCKMIHTITTSSAEGDTGGETGGHPHTPPPPPPPPAPGG